MQIKFKQTFFILVFALLYFSLFSFQLILEKWVFLVAPIILAFFIYYLGHLDKFLMLIVFFTPISLSLEELGFHFENVNLLFPTEFFLCGFLFLVGFKIINNPALFKEIFNHQISYFLFLYLLWMLVCSVTSTLPMVSFKMMLTRLWYIVPFFVFGSVLCTKNSNNIIYFIIAYCLSFSFVVVFTLYKHSQYFFSGPSSNWVVSPFFNDHTSYGAMLAFFIPILGLFCLSSKISRIYRVISFLCFFLFFIGLIFSYTRAAWISLIMALCFGIFLKFKLRIRHIVSMVILFFICLLPFKSSILSEISNNKQDSSSSFSKHIQSIYNIKSDASNMERINRWKCAIKMFKEKPFFGYGPGTYQFQYGVFQRQSDKTIISTNSGNMGNAHSEYLSALSETGFFGLIFFLCFIVFIFKKGISLYYIEDNEYFKIYLLGSLIALTTYFVHALFNNFLDMDKASVPIWFFVAIIVSIDILKSKT